MRRLGAPELSCQEDCSEEFQLLAFPLIKLVSPKCSDNQTHLDLDRKKLKNMTKKYVGFCKFRFAKLALTREQHGAETPILDRYQAVVNKTKPAPKRL